MKERLHELIRILKKEKVAERIKNEGQEKKFQLFQETQRDLENTLKEFKSEAIEVMKYDQEKIIIRDFGEINPDDAIEIGLICMLTEIDDCNLLSNYGDLQIALYKKGGTIANKMAKFLLGDVFSSQDTESLLNKFFGC